MVPIKPFHRVSQQMAKRFYNEPQYMFPVKIEMARSTQLKKISLLNFEKTSETRPQLKQKIKPS